RPTGGPALSGRPGRRRHRRDHRPLGGRGRRPHPSPEGDPRRPLPRPEAVMTGQLDDLKNLWRDQPTETPPMTLEQIHARGFQDRVQRRNRIEYLACAIVVVVFSAYVFILPGPV